MLTLETIRSRASFASRCLNVATVAMFCAVCVLSPMSHAARICGSTVGALSAAVDASQLRPLPIKPRHVVAAHPTPQRKPTITITQIIKENK